MPIVKNKQARVFNLGDHVVLMPGNNDVDSKAWAEAKKIATVRHLIDEGAIAEVSEAQKASDKGDLTGMTVPEAQKIIEDTFDRDLLAKWKKADERKGVADAIDAQLELLKLEDEANKAKK